MSLLLPVQRAAETCPWLKAMVDAGEIFHPLRWKPDDAFRFLQDVPHLESAGVVVRMPAPWRANRPPRPRVTATVGGKAPSGLGTDALLDFHMEVTLDGETSDRRRDQGVAGQIGWARAGPRALGGSRPRAAEPHAGALPSGRARGRREWPQLWGSHAPAGRRRCRAPSRERRRRLGSGGRRTLAARNAERTSQPGGTGPRRTRRGAERHAAALPAGGRALALPPLEARSGRLPCR